ncbi:MAG: DNA primase [Candidatus Peribacter sp.]|jgi:DNA primase|nr:DNA primase [Candidatus Peribacter sp.]MBT4392609.1 DNA primase [Candidatus Peribacter sp.]MBT4600421.1 DNA primase [Candidatus Peribacter sp.]MBT5149087.1 DNA primase [Candidatus Peribacter sp.]MBT5637563.1 DNA primase [Candidatus Peribacter sp.]
MDPTLDIKSRLPIEELVGQYCQLKKKGSGFVCVCPFHQDKHPSMQISPDKGIAYCFACSSGGDIFSFYQKIEGVDFKQALKDLGERTGVKIEGLKMEAPVQKDHKERIRECLQAAQKFYASNLEKNAKAKLYVENRKVTKEQVEEFGLGVAPDSFSDTYEHLLKTGFSRKEIVDASLGIQKELQNEKIYDRFRNRLMFPISDANGHIVGFGGRTLGEDDAKYINSGDTPVYNKSNVLYGLHHAREAIRATKRVVLVEGYFDVIACHRVGIKNAIAVSGTALTEQHVKTLKRYADTVVLCLDQDRAGQQAAERSYMLCSEVELPVHTVTLEHKDPDDAAVADPEGFKKLMEEGSRPYLDMVIDRLRAGDVSSSEGKHDALKIILPLINAVSSSVERGHYIGKVAGLLSTTETELKQDIQQFEKNTVRIVPQKEEVAEEESDDSFSSAEIALGIVMLFPQLKSLLAELIAPEDPAVAALYTALKESPDVQNLRLEMLDLPEEHLERVSILMLFCEHLGFGAWSLSLAEREMRNNCVNANNTFLKKKQLTIASKLQKARQEGNSAEEGKLSLQYAQVLKLAKMASK